VKEIRDKDNDTKHVNRVGLIHPVWPGLIIRAGHAKRWGDNIRSGAREKRSAVKSLSVYQAKIWIFSLNFWR